MQALCNTLNTFSSFYYQLTGYGSSSASTQQFTHAQGALPNSLVKDPELFLRENSVWFSHLQHNFNQIQSDTVQQEYMVYPNRGHIEGLYLSQRDDGSNSTRKINALYTPMRATGSDERLSLPNKFAPANNAMWITDKQKGCAVAIIKWPKSDNQVHEYAMVHLQPNDWNNHSENKAQLENLWENRDGAGISQFQDNHLKNELQIIFNRISDNGPTPEGCILSFSSFDDQCHELSTQVVGVAKDNEFVFYEQKTKHCGYSPSSCKELTFTSWGDLYQDLSEVVTERHNGKDS